MQEPQNMKFIPFLTFLHAIVTIYFKCEYTYTRIHKTSVLFHTANIHFNSPIYLFLKFMPSYISDLPSVTVFFLPPKYSFSISYSEGLLVIQLC